MALAGFKALVSSGLQRTCEMRLPMTYGLIHAAVRVLLGTMPLQDAQHATRAAQNKQQTCEHAGVKLGRIALTFKAKRGLQQDVRRL